MELLMNLENGTKLVIIEVHADEEDQVVPDVDDPVDVNISTIAILQLNELFPELPAVEDSIDLLQFVEIEDNDENMEVEDFDFEFMDVDEDESQIVPTSREKQQ